ncbi:MAG: hypothetical protein EZS28_041000, partial [Streblomastix strix]
MTAYSFLYEFVLSITIYMSNLPANDSMNFTTYYDYDYFKIATSSSAIFYFFGLTYGK